MFSNRYFTFSQNSTTNTTINNGNQYNQYNNCVLINMPPSLNQSNEELHNLFSVRKNAAKKLFARIVPTILFAFFISNCATTFLENKLVDGTALSSFDNLAIKALTWGSLTSIVELVKDKIALRNVDLFTDNLWELFTGKKCISFEQGVKSELEELRKKLNIEAQKNDFLVARMTRLEIQNGHEINVPRRDYYEIEETSSLLPLSSNQEFSNYGTTNNNYNNKDTCVVELEPAPKYSINS